MLRGDQTQKRLEGNLREGMETLSTYVRCLLESNAEPAKLHPHTYLLHEMGKLLSLVHAAEFVDQEDPDDEDDT